jgi:hypothetical protein
VYHSIGLNFVGIQTFRVKSFTYVVFHQIKKVQNSNSNWLKNRKNNNATRRKCRKRVLGLVNSVSWCLIKYHRNFQCQYYTQMLATWLIDEVMNTFLKHFNIQRKMRDFSWIQSLEIRIIFRPMNPVLEAWKLGQLPVNYMTT